MINTLFLCFPLDFPSVDVVILSEFGGVDDVTLCIDGTNRAKAVASCNGRCDETTTNLAMRCQCDPRCVIYGECCYDYELFCNLQSMHASNQQDNFPDDKFENISWSNYISLIETLDNVLSSQQMNRVYNRSATSVYDCMTTNLTPTMSYYLISR